ncbi:unnamed protein product [Ectocarpus sp. 6 AP-2014]
MITEWTSSGETAAFETIELGVQGTVIGLHGVLADSDWLSILEVGILVDDGNDDGVAVVEAGELGPVASSAEFYDLRLADTVGCDPAGCSAALTRGDGEWLSIIETEIMVLSDGDDVVQTPGPTDGHEVIPTPSPTTTTTTTTTPTPALPPTTVNPCLDPLHADYACQGGEDDGLYPPPDSVVLTDCGLTDADWEDIKACLVVAGEETDTTITTLIMSGNPDITTVPEGLFEVSPSLASSMTWLSLEYNALTTIPGGMFDSLVKLWGLFLTGNGLSELPEGIFDTLGALDWLFLYDNSLSSLPAGVFDNQVALFYLYLYNNDLVTLPADIFEALGALGELRLDGNPSLQCLPASTVMMRSYRRHHVRRRDDLPAWIRRLHLRIMNRAVAAKGDQASHVVVHACRGL